VSRSPSFRPYAFPISIDRMRLRYGELRTEVVERIEFELDIISRKRFTDYFGNYLLDLTRVTSRVPSNRPRVIIVSLDRCAERCSAQNEP